MRRISDSQPIKYTINTLLIHYYISVRRDTVLWISSFHVSWVKNSVWLAFGFNETLSLLRPDGENLAETDIIFKTGWRFPELTPHCATPDKMSQCNSCWLCACACVFWQKLLLHWRRNIKSISGIKGRETRSAEVGICRVAFSCCLTSACQYLCVYV